MVAFLPAQLCLPAVASGTPLLDRIHHLDALVMLKALPANSIDMVFIDPPYGHKNNDEGDLIQRWEAATGKQIGAGAARPIANDGLEANDLLRRVLPEINRVLKRGAVLCCCCGGGGGPDPQFARWSLWIDEVMEFKQMIVWDKGAMGMGWHYRRSYETVLVAQKSGAACKWYDSSLKIENIIRPNSGIPKIIPTADDHPTPKPPELAEHFIRLHTRPGETVLDCFMGGGSTALAARRIGRRYIGGDISREYVALSRRRLAQPFTLSMFDRIEKPAAPVQISMFAEATL